MKLQVICDNIYTEFYCSCCVRVLLTTHQRIQRGMSPYLVAESISFLLLQQIPTEVFPISGGFITPPPFADSWKPSKILDSHLLTLHESSNRVFLNCCLFLQTSHSRTSETLVCFSCYWPGHSKFTWGTPSKADVHRGYNHNRFGFLLKKIKSWNMPFFWQLWGYFISRRRCTINDQNTLIFYILVLFLLGCKSG